MIDRLMRRWDRWLRRDEFCSWCKDPITYVDHDHRGYCSEACQKEDAEAWSVA